MGAARARPTGVIRWHRQQHTAVPRHLVVELAFELAPPLVENSAVQARVLAHHLAVLFSSFFRKPEHITYL